MKAAAGTVGRGSWIRLAGGERATVLSKHGREVRVLTGYGKKLVLSERIEIDVVDGSYGALG